MRDLDLIFTNDQDMRLFLEFLAYEVNSVDGVRDSFDPLNDAIMQEIQNKSAAQSK